MWDIMVPWVVLAASRAAFTPSRYKFPSDHQIYCTPRAAGPTHRPPNTTVQIRALWRQEKDFRCGTLRSRCWGGRSQRVIPSVARFSIRAEGSKQHHSVFVTLWPLRQSKRHPLPLIESTWKKYYAPGNTNVGRFYMGARTEMFG